MTDELQEEAWQLAREYDRQISSTLQGDASLILARALGRRERLGEAKGLLRAAAIAEQRSRGAEPLRTRRVDAMDMRALAAELERQAEGE